MQSTAKFLAGSCFLAALLLPATHTWAGTDNPFPEAWNQEMPAQLREEAFGWEKSHQLSEEAFIRMCQEPGAVILDASARETYKFMHVRGAVHLTRREMNAESLGKILPDKNTLILTYENNNYRAWGIQRGVHNDNGTGIPFSGDWSGQNLFTYITLRQHGYHNVYALAPYIRVDRGSLPQVVSMSTVDLGQPVTLSLRTGPVRPILS